MPPAQGLGPFIILVLCVVAGVGTVLLLPGRREAAFRKIGGVILAAAGLIFLAFIERWAAGRVSMGAYFWIFSGIAILGAVRVVTHPRPVYSALYFVLTVFASAGLFVLLMAQFMAAALVLIYAGAILVTYVFVIMLASQASAGDESKPLAGLAEYDVVSREPIIATTIGFALMGVLLFVIFDKAQGLTAKPQAAGAQFVVVPNVQPTTQPGLNLSAAGHDSDGEFVVYPPSQQELKVTGNTQQLGAYLFQNQLINLELAGVILTVSMVGAIVIARRRVESKDEFFESGTDEVIAPATPVDDNPHSIPVTGTRNPRQKAWPET